MTQFDCDPLAKSREELAGLMDQISMSDSPVGIDAKYTHAVIIDYLRQIVRRLDYLERQVKGSTM